jgi:O-antigen/teichoic acid export membrane protein
MSGKIAKQSFWASIVNYSGSLIGLFTTFYLFPLVYTESENGIIGLFIEMGALLAGVAQLGTGYSIWKFFPKFKNDSGHNGAGFWLIAIPFIGFLIVAIILIFFQVPIMQYIGRSSTDFEPYYLWLLPFIFFFVYNNVFEVFSASIGSIIWASFLRENVVRIFLGLIGWLYFIQFLPFEHTVHLVPAVYAIVAILNIVYILKNTQIGFKPNMEFIHQSPGLKSEFAKYTLYLFFTYTANMIVQRLDFVMISSLKGFSDTGIYRIAVSMAVLIEIPTRSILQISNPKLSEAMHAGDTSEMKRLYDKTSLNQFVLGALVLLLLWINIDFFYTLMPNGDKYVSGKWALLFLGIGKLIILMQGNSSAMLTFSHRYYLSLLVNVTAVIVGIILNNWAIPIWGIEGAAIATAGTWAASSTVVVVLIWNIFKLTPFSLGLIKTIALFVAVFLLAEIWKISPQHPMAMLLFGLKSFVFFGGSILVIYHFRLSDDIRSMVDKGLNKLSKK